MLSMLRSFAQIDIAPSELQIPQTDPGPSTLTNTLSILFAVLGAVAFLMIVLAGMRYSLSRGNPDAVSKAKNSIIYAAVGLVVAMMAFAIVRFVARSV